jgi:hypothetical protein
MKFDLGFFLKRQWGAIVLLLACIFISLALSDIPFLVSNYSNQKIPREGFQEGATAASKTSTQPTVTQAASKPSTQPTVTQADITNAITPIKTQITQLHTDVRNIKSNLQSVKQK